MAIPHSLETIELPNGTKGFFVNTPGAPVTAYEIHFRSGSDKATRAYPYQVAHTLEHIVEAGPDNPKYPKKSHYLQELQRNGAWRNAYTGEFGISYIGDCIPDELVRILKLRLNAAEKPKLTPENLKSESGNVMEEMRQRVADYTRLASALSRKKLSDGAWQTSKEAMIDAASVTMKDVVSYYTNTHTAKNLRFIVVGDIDDTAKQSIVKLFSSHSLPAGERLDGPNTLPTKTHTYSYEHRSSLENIFTSFVMAIPRQLSAREVAVMDVINNILCNSWDSRILGAAREAGLCYSMRGYNTLTKNQTIWAFDTPISPKNAPGFFQLMGISLRDVASDRVRATELKKAKDFLVGRMKKDGQTTQALLGMYSDDYFARDVITGDQDRINFLKAVSSKDVARLVREFIQSNSRVFSGVGSIQDAEFKKIYEPLEQHING